MFDIQDRARLPGAREGSLVFVYGSLRSGGINHDILRDLIKAKHAKRVGHEARVHGLAIVDIGGLPALYQNTINYREEVCAVGEIYRCTAAARALLDAFEGHPRLYRRGGVMATTAADDDPRGRDLICGVYYGPIPGADWVREGRPLGNVVLGKKTKDGVTISDWQDAEAVRKVAFFDDGGVYWEGPYNER